MLFFSQVNTPCLPVFKKVVANIWPNETTEFVRDIKRHHAEHRDCQLCSLYRLTFVAKSSSFSFPCYRLINL